MYKWLAVGLVLGVSLSSLLLYVYYNAVISSLQEELRLLTARYAQLETMLSMEVDKNRQLSNELSLLQSTYSELQGKYSELNNRYRALELRYSALESKYTQLVNIAASLNSSLLSLHERAMELCCVPYTFRRTLTLSEVKKISTYVYEAGVRANDPASSIQKIYEWIKKKVSYAYDTVLILPYPSTCIEFDGRTYCSYTAVELDQQIQTPEFTASTGRGDCDDQAILAYAMIKYYFIFIHGRDYDLWIAEMEFSSNMKHLAVFLPVSGGKLTIIDPAGSYLTSEKFLIWQSITSRSPLEELSRYESHLGQLIVSITLYRVDVNTGGYETLITGDKVTVANFIQRTG